MHRQDEQCCRGVHEYPNAVAARVSMISLGKLETHFVVLVTAALCFALRHVGLWFAFHCLANKDKHCRLELSTSWLIIIYIYIPCNL